MKDTEILFYFVFGKGSYDTFTEGLFSIVPLSKFASFTGTEDYVRFILDKKYKDFSKVEKYCKEFEF